VFTDYMRPAMRLAAIMGVPVTYILTHDSIGVGEDGPTHQPIEHLAMMRATPGWTDIRPADANETVEAWKIALQHKAGPVGLMLTRQNLPTIDRTKYAAADGVAKGAYVLADAALGHVPDVIILASGSEVAVALEAHERLVSDGVKSRVVNMASMHLFAQQNADYRESVLPPACTARLAVEAGVTFGWDRWIGDGGQMIGLDHFGASAPAGTLFKEFGFTADNVYARAKALV
jgi:transketolase